MKMGSGTHENWILKVDKLLNINGYETCPRS